MLDIKTKRILCQFGKGLVLLILVGIAAGSGIAALSAASTIFFGQPFYWVLPAFILFIGHLVWDWARFKVEMQMHQEQHLVKTLSEKHER